MNIDKKVVLRGAAFALILATPGAFINTYLQGQTTKEEGALFLSYLLIVIGFGVGGSVAGSEAKSQAAKHGALAGLVAFVPIQIIGLISPNGTIRVFSIVFLGFLAAAVGTIGAMISTRRQAGRQK